MDVGKSARKSARGGRLAKLSDTVQGMMNEWTEDNFQMFQETMEIIREGAPVQWVKLYIEAVKLGIEKNTNINININRQQDRANLQAMVRSRIPGQLTDTPRYTPFEEVKEPAGETAGTDGVVLP